MANFFRSLSKHTLAFIIIGAGILLIVASDPPASVCGRQINSFEASQVGFLVKDSSNPSSRTPRFDRLHAICEQANSLGGCYELLNSIREGLDQSKLVSLECVKDLGDSSLFQTLMQKSLDLMIKLAWGLKAPEAPSMRLGWFEGPQVELFCRLQDQYISAYGENAWAVFREPYLANLPGAKELGREQAWGRSILSESCGYQK